jgi:hypothetical protein
MFQSLRNTPFDTGGCVVAFRVLVAQIEIPASLDPCRCNLVSATRGSGDCCPQHRQSNKGHISSGRGFTRGSCSREQVGIVHVFVKGGKSTSIQGGCMSACGDRTQGLARDMGGRRQDISSPRSRARGDEMMCKFRKPAKGRRQSHRKNACVAAILENQMMRL